MAIYLYCLTEPGRAPPEDLRGVARAKVRVVDVAGRLAAWVSDLPEELGAATTEQVQLHDHVVRAALAKETPLPARFGQSFAGDSALRRALEARVDLLVRSLERVRGGVEMTVRILLPKSKDLVAAGGVPEAPPDAPDGGFVGARGEADRAERASVPPGVGAAGSGTPSGAGRAYLARLRERQRASAELQRQAEFLQARVARAVDGIVREEVCSPVMLGSHSFAVSHLLAREAVGEYRLAVDSLINADPALRLLVSGPWAPYSFARLAND
ncbi:MAG TPA: GvpL/GvpF family gas vesicle protein [Gemmatimonadaceae bacterium]|nr:GvpL/GvpF family gas vesicle protein [Gemmatimonadaceae bacterium]